MPQIIIKDSQSLMDYISLKTVDYLDWQDFNHLKHEDVGSGMIVEIYELEDAKLKVIGKSYDEKPEKIILIKNGEDIILKEWNE